MNTTVRCGRSALPTGITVRQIASHACRKYSGRVGRSAAAKRLDEEAVQLAVVAHVRHDGTRYDELLARGVERRDARERIREDVDRVLSARWRKGLPALRSEESGESTNEEEEEHAWQAGGRQSNLPDQDDD